MIQQCSLRATCEIVEPKVNSILPCIKCSWWTDVINFLFEVAFGTYLKVNIVSIRVLELRFLRLATVQLPWWVVGRLLSTLSQFNKVFADSNFSPFTLWRSPSSRWRTGTEVLVGSKMQVGCEQVFIPEMKIHMTLEMVQRVWMGMIQQVFIHSRCQCARIISLYEAHVRTVGPYVSNVALYITTLNTRAYAYFG